jgi:hypothetical protein
MSSSNQVDKLDSPRSSSPSLPPPTTLVAVASNVDSVPPPSTTPPPTKTTSTAVTTATATATATSTTVVDLTVPNNANKHKGKGKGRKYFDQELLHLLHIMEKILPIGPDEWDKVLQEHSIQYPGRDVESLRRKYTNMHRKKAPTGDPNCPPAIKLAKKVKYLIGERAELGGGEDLYDMEKDRFDGGGSGNISPVNIEVPSVVRTASAVRVRDDVSFASSPQGVSNNGMSARGTRANNGKNDLMNFMLLQMQSESKERESERRERAEDRRAMTNVITTIAAGYFGSKKKRKKHKRKKKRK